MRLFLIDPHDTRLYNDGLFDTKLDPNFIIWQNIRTYLKSHDIKIATIDRHPIEEAERIYFLDHNSFSLQSKGPSQYLQQCITAGIPRSKLFLVISECPIIKPESWLLENHQFYSTIFTWNDSYVDNKTYFPFKWTQNTQGIQKEVVRFGKKKLLTLINAHKTNYFPNELYSKRIEAIRFYENNYANDFDLYGIGWDKPLNIKFLYSVIKGNIMEVPRFVIDFLRSYKKYSSYRGSVQDKINTLRQYKFCLCFENMQKIDGYITEKIFDCLKAGTVPVYLGAQNIQRYIPKEAFIDFREYNDFEKLTDSIKHMTEVQYNKYMLARDDFLKHEFYTWDYKHFADDVFLHDR